MSLSITADSQKNEALGIRILAACSLILVGVIDSQVIGAVAPQIAAGLDTQKTVIAGSVTAYSIAAAAVALLLGKYSHKIQPSNALTYAAAAYVFAAVLTAASPHVFVFFTARAAAGLAGGLISALAIAAIANASTYAKRGNYMSGVAVSYFLAPVLGVPLATLMTGKFGWRTVFLLSSVLGLFCAILTYRFRLPSSTSFEDSSAAREDSSTPVTSNNSSSLWDMATRSRSNFIGIISAFFISGGLVGFTTYVGTWLSDAFHADARQVGFVYGMAGLGAVAGGALGGFFADRFGKRSTAVKSCLGMAILLVALPTFTWGTSLFAIMGCTAFFAALRVAPLQALVTEFVGPAERAPYIALRNGASQLGIAAAVAVNGRLYSMLGLTGVGLLCALLTIGACISIKSMRDPHASRSAEVVTAARGKRIARFVVASILVAALIVSVGFPWLLSVLLTKARTRPNERARVDTPASLGAVYENAAFNAVDGTALSGWYLPSRSEKSTIILTHGLFRSRYEMLRRGVDLWNEGYGVLLYDLRRHGLSNAEFSTAGFNERWDVLAAIGFVKKRAPQDKIVLMGVSMGAAASLLAAAETEDVSAIVAESSFLSFRDVADRHISLLKIPAYPLAPMLVWFTAWRMNFSPDDFDVLEAVKKIRRPILFIGGSEDVRMPNETVLKPLFDAAENPSKRMFIVKGAKHGQAYDKYPEGYRSVVVDFLRAADSYEAAKRQ